MTGKFVGIIMNNLLIVLIAENDIGWFLVPLKFLKETGEIFARALATRGFHEVRDLKGIFHAFTTPQYIFLRLGIETVRVLMITV